MLLSGGVDSTVCAALMNRALGVDRVIAIHIDNGFMRKNESDQVRDSLAQLGLDVKGEDQIKKLKIVNLKLTLSLSTSRNLSA